MIQSAALAQDLFPKSYKPKTNSQIPGSFCPSLLSAWESEAYQNLEPQHQALYDKMSYFLKWDKKQKVQSGNTYISGWTRRVTAKQIREKFFKSIKKDDTINAWLKVLCDSGLLVQKYTQGKVRQFLITHWQSPQAIKTWEENATKREIAIAEVALEKRVTKADFTNTPSPEVSDPRPDEGLLFNKETLETSSSPANGPEAVKGLDSSSSSSSATTEQENQLFELWSLKHNKKYIPRAAFLKHLRGFEKATFEWQDLEPEAAQRVLGAVIPTMPTEDQNGRPIGSPMWLIKDDRNHKYLREGLKAEGIDIGQDLSEVNLVSQVTTNTHIKTKPKYFKPTLTAKNESPETERITFTSVKEMLEEKRK